MRPVTTRIPDDTHRILEDMADEQDRSVSELVREHVEKGLEYDDRVEELERQVIRLENEKRALIEDREERQQLVKYVEDELSYREAGLGTRMKWFLFGKKGE